MVKGLAAQIKTKCFKIFFRLLPMIYNSNQQHKKMVGYRSSLERRGLCLPGPFEANELLLRPAKYLYHVELPNSATRGAAVMPAVCPAAQI